MVHQSGFGLTNTFVMALNKSRKSYPLVSIVLVIIYLLRQRKDHFGLDFVEDIRLA